MIKSILQNLGFLKMEIMLSNLGCCGMINTLKDLGQRIRKRLENCSTARHKECVGKVKIV
jgi:hypothetical protein